MAASRRWAFLDPYFARLRGRLRVAEPGRLDSEGGTGFGRDPETDWWLVVDWFGLVVGVLCWTQRELELRRMREALVLTSVLAHVDNALWVKKLTSLSEFVPARFMDLASQQLLPHFQLEFVGSTLDPWDVTMKFLLTREDLSEAFAADWARAVELTGAQDTAAWKPKLQLCATPLIAPSNVPDPGGFDISFLKTFESLIHRLQDDACDPAFVLDSLVLKMAALYEDSTAIDILRSIIECGVPVESIRLPDGTGIPGDRESAKWTESWIRFVCSLCGNPMTPVPRPISVKTISVSTLDVYHSDFLLLSSALLHSRGVLNLVIESREGEENLDPQPFPPFGWDVVGLAVLSRDSTSSVESLAVRGVPITLECVDSIFNAISLVFPLNSFYLQWVPNALPSRPAGDDPTEVCIPVGTTIHGRYGLNDEPYSIVTDCPTHGIVVDENETEVRVLIPGRGFCSIARSDVPVARFELPRLYRDDDPNSSSLLRSLELVTVPGDTSSQAQVAEFLQYAGHQHLESLRLKIPNLTEESIRSIFSMCPYLEHLAVGCVSLPSMDAFEAAFESGVRLQSLELNASAIPTASFQSFLRKYCAPEPTLMEACISRLRLGPLQGEQLQVLGPLLSTSRILCHLEYVILDPVQDTYENLVLQYHGRSVGVVREPLPRDCKLAFLGALWCLTKAFPQFHLADEIKLSICTFAATPQTRSVVCSSRLGIVIPRW